MIKLLTHLTVLRGSHSSSSDLNIHIHLTSVHCHSVDQTGTSLSSVVWMRRFWPDCVLLKSWSLSPKFLSVCVFAASQKKRTSGKYKPAPIYSLIWDLKVNQLMALSLFWNELYPMHYGRQASVCSVISKLSRRGCWVFIPLCFPRCQADRQWKPACRKHEILASARTPKSPWRFWQRETGGEAAENGLVRVITSQ